MSDKITTTGGVLIRDNDVLFDFSNTSVAFEVMKDFDLVFNVLPTDQTEQIYSKPYALLRLSINDVTKDITIYPSSDELVHHVKAGEKVRILKLSEAFTGLVKIVNLMSQEIKAVPKEEKVKVEFIGDSLTSGYGNDGDMEGIFNTDWTKTWCSHLCNHFNWEAMVHSYSCMGLVRDSSYDTENQIAERRRRVIGTDETTVFDFSTFKASYVIINIGSNDFGNGFHTRLRDEFIEKMKALIEELYQQYGEKLVVILVHGPMMMESSRDVIKSIPPLYNNTSRKVYVTETRLPREAGQLWGKCYHPTAMGHRQMADQLIKQFEQIVQ